jgi:hypothetical protein
MSVMCQYHTRPRRVSNSIIIKGYQKCLGLYARRECHLLHCSCRFRSTHQVSATPVCLDLTGLPTWCFPSYFSTTASFALLLSILTIYAPAYTLPIPYFELFGFASTENRPMNATAASTAGLLDRLTWTRLFSQVQCV